MPEETRRHGDSSQLIQLAELAFRRADLSRVDQLCQEVLKISPNSPQAHLLAGMSAVRQERHEEAVALLRKTLKLSVNDHVAMLWLPLALRGAAKPMDAIEVGEQARRLWPDDPEVLGNLALDYFNVKNYTKSEECLRGAMRVQPMNPSLHRKLGSLYEAMGRDEDAKAAYEKAVEVAPAREEGYAYLGRLLIGHGNFSQAIELCRRGERLIPRSAQMHLMLAQALRGVWEHEEAEGELRKAIELDPNIVLAAALWLNEDGRFEEAGELFRRSIRQRPTQGTAYFGLVKGKKTTESDRELIAEMESLAQGGNLPPKEAAAIQYALGKAADDLKEYEKAMRHFDEANRLKYRIHLEGRGFDLNQAVRHREQLEELFTKEFMEEHRLPSDGVDAPIFIIGMIRSGTTLLEQIVASHPDVGGAGEQRFWVTELPMIVDVAAKTFDDRRFAEARTRYLRVLRGLQPSAQRITDKMPMNYYCAGVLHMAFPASPILHIRRNALDTALSIYMTDLAKPPEFAHNKANIAAAYREYGRVMELWRSLIPPDRLFEVRYEDLIEDQETWTRKVIDFCRLPWDPACLEFHKSERQVSTPSMWQVRQPIYRTSMEKWRNYEPWLGELGDLAGV